MASMFRKSLIFFLIAIFCSLQASPGLTALLDWCVWDSSPMVASMSSNNSYSCCCCEKGPCCCEAEQEPIPQLPDMALNATSSGHCDYVPRFATSDAGIQNLISAEHQELSGVLNDTGPPPTSFYLTNLTFRCWSTKSLEYPAPPSKECGVLCLQLFTRLEVQPQYTHRKELLCLEQNQSCCWECFFACSSFLIHSQ